MSFVHEAIIKSRWRKTDVNGPCAAIQDIDGSQQQEAEADHTVHIYCQEVKSHEISSFNLLPPSACTFYNN